MTSSVADPVEAMFLGLTTIDLQYVVDSFPEANTKNKAVSFNMAVGGPAVNAAATFAALGGDASLLTVIGDHSVRNWIQEDFRRYGIKWTDMSPGHSNLPVMASVWTSSQNGDRTIVTNPRLLPDLNLEALNPDKLRGKSVLLLDGFHMKAAIRLAQMGRERGIPVVMDGGSWKPYTEQLIRYVDMAICSADFQVPGGIPVLQWLQEQGVPYGAVTNGEKPIQYVQKGQAGIIPVSSVSVVDTLGAGDVFHGAFCYYLTQQNDFPESLRLASLIAGKSCQYVGAKTWIQ